MFDYVLQHYRRGCIGGRCKKLMNYLLLRLPTTEKRGCTTPRRQFKSTGAFFFFCSISLRSTIQRITTTIIINYYHKYRRCVSRARRALTNVKINNGLCPTSDSHADPKPNPNTDDSTTRDRGTPQHASRAPKPMPRCSARGKVGRGR